jgi:ubiquinone/menaquinone biosynthesis C-methylase UbiE
MSSSVNNKNNSWLKQKLIVFHHKYSKNIRSEILGKKIAEIIISETDCSKRVEALDFGCSDMKIASCIHQIIPEINWIGTDIYENPENEKFPFRYIKYEKCKLPFADKNFKVVIMCDVLHHIVEKEQSSSFSECLRVGEKVIIKDTFEKGYLSRLILILMDFFGNWAYGIRIPTHYLTRKSFLKYCNDNSIDCKIKVSEIELYKHLPFFIRFVSPPSLHFIAVLKENKIEKL